MKSTGRLIGFDYGSQRIGVSVGNKITRTAQPLEVIHNQKTSINWSAILKVIQEWKPEILVIGLPLSHLGEETKMSREARSFAKKLGNKSKLDYIMVDERYSTYQANHLISHFDRSNQQVTEIDDVAAQIILETYFSNLQEKHRN
ncbi:MAG: Holliday junction resolvase RuvX [Gammaproteobacteria bacterium]|nr:Holliday junction resolvase RuvX [Gammaproteobacteria bacterium]MCY4218384.1 Holliday junction resolvase RuvX [Gammaproteobacteria bacterium]MCY4274288.1 Holliday junction resolvase RuvX [Gammaproteobacteria bacterium]